MKRVNLLVLGLVLILFSVAYATITSINLISPPNGTWVTTSTPTFQFNATSDINTTFSCTLYVNDTPYGTNSSVVNGTLTSIIANATIIDGFHSWYLNCTDVNGTVQSVIYIVGIDTAAPTVSANPTSQTWTNQNITVQLTASDSLSGVKTLYYGISLTSTCTGVVYNSAPGSTATATISGEGSYYLCTYAVDNAGNAGTPTAYGLYQIDTVPPKLNIITPTQTNYTTVNITANWTGSDLLSGLAYYNISIDGGTPINVGLNTTYNLTNLSQGTHNFTVMAVDNAGNINQTTITFVVDTVPPTVSITYPANNSYLNSSTITINWTGSDVGTGIQNYNISIDGGTPINVGLNTTYTLNGLADGAHNVTLEAIDYVGHVNKTTVFFIVDTVPPSVSITSPANGSYFNVTSVTINWTGSDATSGIRNYYIGIDGNQFLNIYLNTSYTFSNLSDGVHNVTVQAIDYAGNLNSTTIYFTIDTVAPTLTILANATNKTWVNYDVNVNATASDLNGVTVYWCNTSITTYCTPTTLYTPGTNEVISAEGTTYVVFKAVDPAGNSNISTFVVKIDKTPPNVTTTVTNFTNPSNLLGNFSAGFNDIPGSGVVNVTLWISDLSNSSYRNYNMNIDSITSASVNLPIGNISDPYLGPGLHYMQVCATDLAGNINCTPWIPFVIEVVDTSTLSNALSLNNISFNVVYANGSSVTTSGINPVLYNYNYIFDKNGFNVTLYNVTLNASQIANMIISNMTIDYQQIINTVTIKYNLSNLTSIWVDFPWVNATEYDYGKVVLNSTYDTLFYCTNSTNCTQISECNATQINYSNYASVIPSDGACYLNENNRTVVYVDHFSGVVAAGDEVPPTITFTCTPSDVYIGGTITCTCNATDNVGVASITYTKHPDTSIVGTFTTKCTAIDVNGNVAIAEFNYTVKSRNSFVGSSEVTPKYTVIIDKLVNETSTRFVSSEIAVYGFDVKVSKPFENVIIEIMKLDNVSFIKPNGIVYQYLEFDLTNINDSGINGVNFYFKVPKTWMSENNVNANEIKFMRYSNGKWIALNTTIINQDSQYVYYKAVSSGFSYYAIVGIKQMQSNVTTNITPTHVVSNENNVSNKTVSPNQTVINPQYNANVNLIFGAIAVIVAIFVIGGIYFMKHKKVKPKRRHK